MKTLKNLASKTYSIAAAAGWLSLFTTGLFIGWLIAMVQIPADCFSEIEAQEKIEK